jgi:hypothetical protein
MKDRIYLKDWLALKPYNSQSRTDSYYLNICNEVKSAIENHEQFFLLRNYMDKKEVDYLACFLTSYFEDLISQTNIWNSFVKVHYRMYKKHLPFYTLEVYFEEEINIQDVSFLIWYFINSIQEERFVDPHHDFIISTAEGVMNTFEKAWDYAPENEYLKSLYKIDENENFYEVRELINRILFETYLFYPDTLMRLNRKELDIIEESSSNENLINFLIENKEDTTHQICTRLLCMKGKEWAAEILADYQHAEDFKNMTERIRGFFLYKGQDINDIFIEHIASGRRFKLTKKSFDGSDDLDQVDTIMFMGIVKWKNEWWFSGIFFTVPFDADLILDEKNSLESRRQVDFLQDQIEKEDVLDLQLKAFKKNNNGFQIAFIFSDEIPDFVNRYVSNFNKSLKLSDKEREEANQRTKQEGLLDINEKMIENEEDETPELSLAFFNPKSGLEFAFNVNCAFPLPNNPFYDPDDSDEDVMFLLMSDEISAELVLFCIENCKNDLPFFKDGKGKNWLNDLDFLLRFWKKNNYFSKPSITFTGEENT